MRKRRTERPSTPQYQTQAWVPPALRFLQDFLAPRQDGAIGEVEKFAVVRLLEEARKTLHGSSLNELQDVDFHAVALTWEAPFLHFTSGQGDRVRRWRIDVASGECTMTRSRQTSHDPTSVVINPAFEDLYVCTTCGRFGGPLAGRFAGHNPPFVQHCLCIRKEEPVWAGFDYNVAAWLCHCCGQTLVPSGSKLSVWFCDGCKRRALGLNASLRRYAIPIGAHSDHGAFSIRADATGLDIEIFTERWRYVVEAMGYVNVWASEIVRRLVAERFDGAAPTLPIREYLAHARTDDDEKDLRFGEMLAFADALARRASRGADGG